MIGTLTINPAIDQHIPIDKLVKDDAIRARDIRRDPGGKGINVSRVVKELGGTTVAYGGDDANSGPSHDAGPVGCRRNMPSSDADLLAVLRALVHLSTVDLLYADQYLYRAELLLPKLCTRQQYRALRHDQVRFPSLTADLRQAAEQGDWSKVRVLAQEAANARERLATSSQILLLADAVYGPRLLHVDAVTLALSGVVAQPVSSLIGACDAILEQLRTLVSLDREWASFYQSRVMYFEHCQLVRGENAGPAVDATHLRQQILAAVAAGDFARVKRLTDSLETEHSAVPARLRAPRPREERVRRLVAGFSDAAEARAGELGLALETLPRASGLNEYLSCCCADRATLPETPLAETHKSTEHCTCGHACPPDVRSSLRENLDLLMGHPFISSAGLRYLPWFGPETVLVETFPETDPDVRTGLLGALGLPKRRGLTRLVIEDALLTNGPHVCANLGLDPAECTVACIPFDAYLRLAPKYGWGRQEFWTHFDGYQVTRELRLRALVGGDARYGGPDDLCGVERDYNAERLTARFVILRRDRFLVRETQGEP